MRSIPELRVLRDKLRCTQYEISNVSGVERSRLSLIENERITPTPEEVVAIETALLGELRHRKEELSVILAGA